ncbi:MAG TPA: response regulator transcription factor, partial [Rhizobiales bacterium]|nr:response regulator transcription factor [Hyphomicrobiales bacterium]
MVANRIIIADDHPLFRDALEQTIAGAMIDLEIRQAGSLENVISALDGPEEFDLILLDLKMPGVQGFSGLIFLR